MFCLLLGVGGERERVRKKRGRVSMSESESVGRGDCMRTCLSVCVCDGDRVCVNDNNYDHYFH